MRRTLSLFIVMCLVVGCNKNKADEQEAKQRELDAFERSEDPPLNANTRFAAGQLAESMGDYGRAIAQYQEALKLDPKHRDALFRLGSVMTTARQYPQAITVWQRYIEVTDHAPAAYNNLAYTQEVAGQLSDAEKTYRACIERDPANQACRINYGKMLARHGRIDDAVKEMSSVLKPAEVTYNLGAVFEQQGKLDEAKAYYRRSLEQDPNLTDAKARLAQLK